MTRISLPRLVTVLAVLFLGLFAIDSGFGHEVAVGVALTLGLAAQGLQNHAILGAQSLGALSPDVVSLTVLDNLKKIFPTLNLVTTDFSKEPVKWNKKTTTRVVTVPTVSDFDQVNGYVAGDAVTTDIDITLNKWKHVTLEFSAAEVMGTDRRLAQEQMMNAAYALGKQVFTDLYALVTTANFTNAPVTVSIANTARSTVNAARKAMTKLGCAYPRMGVMNCDAFESLTNDDKIISNLYVPDDGTALPVNYVDGVINNLAGFQKIFEFPDLPATNNISGFFAAKSALAIIARVPEDAGLFMQQTGVPIPGKIETFTDPLTGLTIMARYSYDMKLAKLTMTLVLMYGVAVGVQSQGQLLVTA